MPVLLEPPLSAEQGRPHRGPWPASSSASGFRASGFRPWVFSALSCSQGTAHWPFSHPRNHLRGARPSCPRASSFGTDTECWPCLAGTQVRAWGPGQCSLGCGPRQWVTRQSKAAEVSSRFSQPPPPPPRAGCPAGPLSTRLAHSSIQCRLCAGVKGRRVHISQEVHEEGG